MTGTKTVAERLREIKSASLPCRGDVLAFALGRKLDCPIGEDCINCIGRLANELADAIEAEKSVAVSKALIEEVAKQENMDSVLLYNTAKDLDDYAHMLEGAVSEDLAHCAGLIRKALRGAKPQLPEGVEWPRFEDGELVKFGDDYVKKSGGVDELRHLSFYDDAVQLNCDDFIKYGEPVKRPEPEVLDADGVPIKVGDVVYTPQGKALVVSRLDAPYVCNKEGITRADYVTHRKPDTQEAINHDAALLVSESFFDQRRDEFEDRVFDLLKRQRKLLGGE